MVGHSAGGGREAKKASNGAGRGGGGMGAEEGLA